MIPTAPTILTGRLRLRHHRFDDFDAMAELFASDRSRYMGGPLSRKSVWAAFGAEVGSWSLLGFGSWAVDLQDGDVCIGQVGINKPIYNPEVELGWQVYEAYEGKGYAREAATAARDFGFKELGLETVVSYIDPENARSIVLAERLGAIRDDRAEVYDVGDLVYRHEKVVS